MAIPQNDTAQIVIERIEAAHPMPGVFDTGETADWPDGCLSALQKVGILRSRSMRPDAIECPGCEERCVKAVVIRRDWSNKQRAFIVCDEDPDYGRITIAPRLLVTYEATLQSLSNAMARALNLGAPRRLPSGNAFVLGQWNGRLGPRQIQVSLENEQLLLLVGTQREHLARAISISRVGLVVDKKIVGRLAARNERPQLSDQSYAPDRSRQRERRLKTNSRNTRLFREAKSLHVAGNSWSDAARTLAGTKWAPGLEASTVRRIIATQLKLERK